MEFFPEWNYNRAIKIPTEYISERFHILPEATRKYFLQVFSLADKATADKENEIRLEFEHVNAKLSVDVEKAVNERLLSEVVASRS